MLTVVSTSVGDPFSRYGRYRAAFTASSAAACSTAGPLTTRALSIFPDFEITASTTTVPSVRLIFAIIGYTG